VGNRELTPSLTLVHFWVRAG
jgi:hypothetical protein